MIEFSLVYESETGIIGPGQKFRLFVFIPMAFQRVSGSGADIVEQTDIWSSSFDGMTGFLWRLFSAGKFWLTVLCVWVFTDLLDKLQNHRGEHSLLR